MQNQLVAVSVLVSVAMDLPYRILLLSLNLTIRINLIVHSIAKCASISFANSVPQSILTPHMSAFFALIVADKACESTPSGNRFLFSVWFCSGGKKVEIDSIFRQKTAEFFNSIIE